MKIQIWAPGVESSSVVLDMSHAQFSPLLLSDLRGLQSDLPLLLLYDDPLACIRARDPAQPAAGISFLLAALPALLATGPVCRLVNRSCMSLPALVAWCIDAASPTSIEGSARFPGLDPFEALLTIEWLQGHPEQLQAYQTLEAHPLAAALDHRSPDLHCLERYRQAANLEALLQARQERVALETDLRELASQLEPLQHQQLEALAMREQLGLLQARLQEADALQARCSDLQLSVQAQQQDLEQLARRLALLEKLVGAGSDASLRLQTRLAQALA